MKTYSSSVTMRPAASRSRFRVSRSYSVGSGSDSETLSGSSLAAGFGTPSAEAVYVPAGTRPTVTVEASGPETAKVLRFKFGIPAAGEDFLAQLRTRPVLTLTRGFVEDGLYRQSIRVSHPLLASTQYEAVLMVYRKCNCRATGVSQTGAKLRVRKKGWAVALGDYSLTGHQALTARGGFSYGASFGLQQLRDFIVQRFMTDSSHTASELLTRTYEQWNSESNAARGFGRGKRLRCRFGVAVRYTNPAFEEAVDKTRTLAPTTLVICDESNNKVERYLYSDVAPLYVMISTPAENKQRTDLWFGLVDR